MALSEQYYQLIERDTDSVNGIWKALHILTLIVAAISGASSAFTFAEALNGFGHNCILFCNISFMPNNSSKRHIGSNDLSGELRPIGFKTEWASSKLCDFCLFTPLMCVIFSIIWCTFFIICEKGGSGFVGSGGHVKLARPWRIVYPAMAFCGISIVAMLVSSLELNDGIKVFCEQFESEFGTKRCTNRIDLYSLAFSDQKFQMHALLQTAIYTSFICLFAWVFELALLILRIILMVDFELLRVSLIEESEDVLQEIVNMDPDDDGSSSIDKSHEGQKFSEKKARHLLKIIATQTQDNQNIPPKKQE